MRLILGTAALALGLLVGPALAGEAFKLDGSNTKVEFVGTKPNGKHTGGFQRLTGSATGADAASLKLQVDIDTTSLYSDNDKLTQHLKSPDFFGVKTHPTAKFVTTKVEPAANGYTVTGDLTLCGTTKTISFPARIAVTAGALSVTSQFPIDRTAFGMSYGRGKIDDQVTLKVAVNARK
jgi:polyisoprenoid-binding protein YceI